MKIIIENKEAVLKKGASFDYISENRFFTGADGYTLSITFPLRGCPQNLEIFGRINRKDHDLDKLLLDCEIHDRGFHAYGAVNIVEISEVEVKTQFLMGRSVRNFSSNLDEVYINELAIGPARDEGIQECRQYWKLPNNPDYTGRVCLPWVNNTSGNMQNMLMRVGGQWYYAGMSNEEPAALSCQYYLVYIIKKVLDACGYRYDLSRLEYSPYRFLVVFNTFPHAWDMDEWGMCLPHWTVTEFLEQVERFTNGQFEIEDASHSVVFSFNSDLLEASESVILEDVIDEHQVEVSEEEDTDYTYLEQINLKYADASHNMQKFYSCDWATKQLGVISYATFANLRSSIINQLNIIGTYGNNPYTKKLLYAKDLDTYFVLQCYKVQPGKVAASTVHHMRLLPVNVFAPKVFSEDNNTEEIKIVPVCIDHCDETVGDCVFLECGTYGDKEDSDENQSLAVNTLIDGEKEQKQEFFDKLYVGFWDGNENVQQFERHDFYPIPWIDNIYVNMFSILNITHMDEQENYSMRLSGVGFNGRDKSRYSIDQSKKFTFKFLVKDGKVPDVRSVFFIHGKKYLAESITASFSEDGMSQLCKMAAYRINS